MVKVLVVDDSALVRRVLSEELARDPDIEVIGTAPDPYVARDKILKLAPDVLTLDIEMPRMDGLSFLRKLMKHKPMPVVVVSSLTPKGSEMAMDALSLGAVDVLCKPGEAYSIGDLSKELTARVKAAARARMTARSIDVPVKPMEALKATTLKIIAIGASTGGTEALREVLQRFPVNSPPTVVVQHMPATFTAILAEHLTRAAHMPAAEAKDGEAIVAGRIYVAPGGKHMVLEGTRSAPKIKLTDDAPVHFCKPAVDPMFDTVAAIYGPATLAVVLTGMGSDGALGAVKIADAGGSVLAQDKATSVVWGMPGATAHAGACAGVMPVDRIAARINEIAMGVRA